MPYCHKCGAELAEDAKFCHVCGTPTSLAAAAAPERTGHARRGARPWLIPVLVLIAILATVLIVGGLAFAPVQPVNFQQSDPVPFRDGVDGLVLNFSADGARVNVTFMSLSGKLFELNTSATGRVSLLSSTNVVNVTFNYAFSGDTLTVTGRQFLNWPLSPWVSVKCDLFIDPSLKSNVNVKVGTGALSFNTRPEVVLDRLNLEAVTGAVEANFTSDVTLTDDVVIRATTGGVDVHWNNVRPTRNISFNVSTTTGGANVNVVQNRTLSANVAMKVQVVTGGVDFALAIHDDVGARIVSNVTTGGIDVISEVGFTGTKSPLQSANYPAGSNFNVSLKTVTGGVRVSADYNSGTVSA